jgi:hypothetical protein
MSPNPRTRALEKFAREYDLRQLLGPVHISMAHKRNRNLFDQVDHKRGPHKAFYAISASLPVVDGNVTVESYKQYAANPHYLDLDLEVALVPDHNQGFRSASDFDEAEIKVVYSHFRSSGLDLPRPPLGCIAPVSLGLEVRGERHVLRFKQDDSAAEDPEVRERWIAYEVTSPGTFFRTQEMLEVTRNQDVVPA